ncbi:NAD(P)H-quinone oxidoreductase [Azospirillum picis]|uniref:PIG3 family NAD(P)H quinone oxidoreductase n=1 Tax=Azospirillum picis TaxID=488438 RepID=A0ABU0MHL4_9PROT|nr:NAD(P)H-quinone oxidoreductase [Azospirillum picis]MBP2298864.1 putative PIG3 family NAD(P)H quinone oxidoreductase [Azospirillum picis]MDQ0532894.1 putative PIG3 family NAD(P)H quinone oxidoreductase [Azospirillum picis]
MGEARTMVAVEVTAPGKPEVLLPGRRPLPKPSAGEIRIAVQAAGVNRPDVLQRLGKYNPPPGVTDIPGLEVAGTVDALGDGVEGWAIGDPICALLAGGGYAEYCVAPAGQCLPVPAGLSMAEAAALPETAFTVWSNLFERGGLGPGEALLVHGGTSGIGTTAIQLGTAFGARVFATARGADKCRACVDLGAERAIDYETEDFVEVVKEATGGAGVNVVLDIVGGDYVARSIDALAVEGRYVCIGFVRGATATVNFFPVMTKRLTLTGSTLRARPLSYKTALAGQLRTRVWPLVAEGRVRPVVHEVFPLSAAAEAHRLMESNQHVGKIVLSVG